jgi:thiosulfate reductase cytochrome b subunit
MKRVYLHPLPLRIWHWVNALMVIFLIATGFYIRVPGIASLSPRDPALWTHKYAGWAMGVSWVFWFIYNLGGHNLTRHYRFRNRDFKGAFRQAKFYLSSIFAGEENPFRPTPEEKFNPLQKLAYGAIMGVFAPALVITGILFSDIHLFRHYLLSWNLAGLINAVHVIGAYGFVFYLVIHLYMATLGRTALSHTKAMITGYEEEPESALSSEDTLPSPEFQKE